MNTEVLSKYDVMTVGEMPAVGLDRALDFVDEDRKELNMFFHFDLMALDRNPGEVFKMGKEKWKLTDFKKIHSDWDEVFSEKGWGSMFLNNHDFPRSVSRWGDDSKTHWYNSATMLQTFLLTMRGTPYFYYGEEIGMTNIKFDSISDYRDINTLNRYETIKNEGGDLQAFIENEKDASRDNARTPMQWDMNKHAGFSIEKPWIQVNKNYLEGINVASQETDKGSVLNYFREAVQLRKNHLALVYGSYELLVPDNEKVYTYTRALDNHRYLIILSFSREREMLHLEEFKNTNAKLLISNDDAVPHVKDGIFKVRPYHAMVYKLD
ncbi:UNVERIFIED_CONTAM: hypothetical protein GTU68_062644 [Idotea baltica]|nr:hypothetical protein [Idotea baltica]